MHVVINWSSRFQKTPYTCNFNRGRLFTHFLKYHIFRNFSNLSAAHAKIVEMIFILSEHDRANSIKLDSSNL